MPKLDRATRERAIAAERERLQREAAAREPRMSADYSYSGAQFWGGLARSQGAKFPGGLSRNIGNRLWNHWGLRQNARDISEDSTHAYAMLHRDADTVVDSGLKVEPTPKFDILGITAEAADEWSMKVHESFGLWCNSKAQHRAGLFPFFKTMHDLQLGHAREREGFLRLYYSQDQELINPLQFEVIDPNQVRGDAVTSAVLPLPNFNDGIIRDKQGREIAYKIWNLPRNENMSAWDAVDIPRIGEKSRRVFMIHGWEAEYPGQGRGYSQMGVNMQEFQELQNYLLATVKKAIAQSQHPMAVQNTQKNPSNFLEEIGRQPAGPGSVVFGATPTPGGIAVGGSLGANQPVSVTQLEEAAFDTPGSSYILNLEQGDEIKYLADTSPSAQFDSFVDAFLTPLLLVYGMPLEWFKQKFEASYSAARGMLASYWRVVMMKRQILAWMYLDTVFEMWLSCEIAAGRIACAGWEDPRLKAAWLSKNWIGTPPVQIDPQKEADAAMKWLEMSATTGERIAREHNQSNFKANMTRNTADFPKMPIPSWQQKITVAATTVEESESKAADKAKQDLAIAKAGAPKPGAPAPAAPDNGRQRAELAQDLRAALSPVASGIRELSAEQREQSERIRAIELRPAPEPLRPAPITVNPAPVSVTMPKIDLHIHNDGETETTITDLQLTPGGDIASAKMTKRAVPVGANGNGKEK